MLASKLLMLKTPIGDHNVDNFSHFIDIDTVMFSDNVFLQTEDGDWLCLKCREGLFAPKRRYAKAQILTNIDLMI